jgi:lipopolysaccharide biosynthesis protein
MTLTKLRVACLVVPMFWVFWAVGSYRGGLVTQPSAITLDVCVFFHLGTPSEWPFYASYLKNLRDVRHDLYVTVTADSPLFGSNWTEFLSRSLPKSSRRRLFVVPMENRGMDGGGFLVALHEALRQGRRYAYLLKLHSKTTRNTGIEDWRGRLLRPIIGSAKQVRECLQRFKEDPTIGMIGAKDLFWSESRLDVRSFASRYNLPSRNPGEPSRFIAGTMFWMRFAVVADLFQPVGSADPLAIYQDAPPGYTLYESTGHMLERLFGDWVELRGYRFELLRQPEAPKNNKQRFL